MSTKPISISYILSVRIVSAFAKGSSSEFCSLQASEAQLLPSISEVSSSDSWIDDCSYKRLQLLNEFYVIGKVVFLTTSKSLPLFCLTAVPSFFIQTMRCFGMRSNMASLSSKSSKIPDNAGCSYNDCQFSEI